ncbi:SDR family NAD(P)-dependent oxidoreductase [Marinobacter caseinilyticus]|uniref:SDR family NAD(P)-dependent oxidoreductase n=1 Tax=Marinobacter caseinilyticus TaxID=2692195 RepID=UPI00140A5DD4|nr:SDR family NAD(P)-dependent oxidoreductase [Marinobacter caseinilyticus]
MATIVVAGVTGGIGRAIAERLLRSSDTRIIGLCRTPEAEHTWVEQAEGRLTLIPWDATDPAGSGVGLEQALAADVQIDGVIYAVGLLHGEGLKPEKRLEELTAGALSHAFMVNAGAFPLLLQALLPWLRHKEYKRFMAISAKVGSIEDNQMGGWYAYRTSKAALNMLVRNLSIELPRRMKPVCCVAVHPGTTKTQLSAPFEQSLAQLQVHAAQDTAANMVAIFEGLRPEDNGRFFSWDGSRLPW